MLIENSITWANWEVKVKIAVGNKKNNCLFLRKEKKMIKFSKYFWGQGLCLTHVGAPCCETWLKFEVAIAKKI